MLKITMSLKILAVNKFLITNKIFITNEIGSIENSDKSIEKFVKPKVEKLFKSIKKLS